MKIERMIEKHYGLRVLGLSRVSEGVGGEVYVAETDAGRFVLKGTPRGADRADNEPYIAGHLARHGIPVAEYLRAGDGEWFVRRGKTQYLLQRFAEGKTYAYHGAPAWLLQESARMLGKIQVALAGYEPLPPVFGQDHFDYLRSGDRRASYLKTLENAKKAGDGDVALDVEYRLSQLHRTRERTYDYARFTVGNTHGDFKIQNIICGEGRIAAVIDLSSACRLPLCMEVIRSYTHAAPAPDAEGLRAYTQEVMRYTPLNDYDLRNMAYVFRDQLLAMDFYGQYYGSKHPNRADFLAQARWATGVLQWLEGAL
ncbi:MAG: phosphotransferase [Oscillospiraceae bacterium]|nr:phosphotransferase [Oscillospiraceae bacterium]